MIPVFSTAGFAVGQRAIVGDCAQSTAFYVTGLDRRTRARRTAPARTPMPTSARAYGPDAMVVPFTTLTYYIAPNGVGDDTARCTAASTVLALSEEIAEGVEDFQLQYGVDTDGDNFADLFVAADAVADWRRSFRCAPAC